MANRFSANFRTEVQTGKDPIPVLELVIDGTTYRYSDVAAASVSRGMYKPQVVTWGTLSYGASDRSNRLQAPALDVTISDTDNELSHLFMGSAARSAIGSTATIYLTYPGLAFVDWFTLFTGQISSRTYEDAHIWRLGLRLDDSAIASRTGDIVVPTVEQGAFDTAPERGLGKPIPIVYGTYVYSYSTNGIKAGIECTPCSTNGDPSDGTAPYRYVVCVGHVRHINYIFTDAATPTATVGVKGTNWFWTERGGRYYTEVGFTSTQEDNEPVYCTPIGLSTSGEGTTTPATEVVNPASIIEHLLTNFVFNKWTKGDWYDPSTDAPIDTASITTLENFFADRGDSSGNVSDDEGSLYTTGGSALSLLNTWCKEYFAACWWNEVGDLQFGLRNPYDSDIYLDNNTPANWPWFKSDEHGRGNKPIYPLVEDDAKVVNKLTYNICFVPKENKYLQTSYVEDTERTSLVEEVISTKFADASGNSTGPTDAMTRRVRRDRFPVKKLKLASNVMMLDPDLFNSVLISDASAPIPESSGTYDTIENEEGWGGHSVTKAGLYSLTNTSINLNSPMVVTCELEDDRLFRCTFFDSGVGEFVTDPGEAGTSAKPIGYLFGSAATAWGRPVSAGWCVQISGKQALRYKTSNTSRREEDGLLVESAVTNHIINSNFLNGDNGWTFTRPTTTLSTFDTGVRLFGDEVETYLGGTNRTVKLGTTTTSASDTNIYRPSTTQFAANTNLNFSFWHRDSDATPAHYSLQRDSDSYWLQSNGTSWGASQYKFVASTANGVWVRDNRTFDIGGSAAKITILVGSPAGADDYTHVAQVQLEEDDGGTYRVNNYMHGTVPTYNSIVTTTQEYYYMNNTAADGYACEYWNQGTFRCIWTPHVGTADMDDSRSIFIDCTNSSGTGNLFLVQYWANPSGNDVFQVGYDDFSYGTTITKTVVGGQDYYIVVRWDGSRKEFNDTSNRILIDIYDVTADSWQTGYAAFTPISAADGRCYIGSSASGSRNASTCNGYLRAVEVLPVVLSNEEIKAYP